MTSPEAWVGTIGQGLWRAGDLETWTRESAVPAKARIYSLAADGGLLFAGGDGCVYRRDGARWSTLPLPDAALQPWSLAAVGATLYAGCRPLTLLRSHDAGAHWQPLDLTLPPHTPRPHTPRITAILAGEDAVWCGAEVGGVFCSEDGGARWRAVNAGLPSLDVHALTRIGGALLAATPRGIARHDAACAPATLDAPWTYCRALAVLPSGDVACGLGNGPPGTRGGVVLSEDDGRTWRSTLFPGTAASTIWSIAVARDVALAAAIGGELYSSDDDGRTWTRLEHAFTEVRAVLLH